MTSIRQSIAASAYNFTDENDYDDLVGDCQAELLQNLRDDKYSELAELRLAHKQMDEEIYQDLLKNSSQLKGLDEEMN